MEWGTLQHLDLRNVGRGVRPLQPHAATFHPHQALVAVAIGTFIVDTLSCFDESFLALAKEQSRGSDIKAQASICAQYKITVTLLQEIGRLQRHRINCIRTAIKRNIAVQNYAYSKQMLELLLSKAPPSKQEEFRSLIHLCVQRGLTNKSIDPLEDPSQFCAATLSRLSAIGYDVSDLCGSKFSAVTAPGCIICGMGSIKRSDAVTGPVPSPFG
ncbi:hypothetical protein GLYMA_11G057700v4 [Glycine max]|uniref:Uncharacterized protein n=1 Tax=Glycine max TaxID=3847 RepID=A0A0R0HJ80_SOYBN|nr:hypothetical protein GYH30_030150 [Glycine max]KRH28498.1 hypothetical protein GLYMA_11G057700v4 [Glycine max]